jgi:hypothetical protein
MLRMALSLTERYSDVLVKVLAVLCWHLLVVEGFTDLVKGCLDVRIEI